MGAEPAAKRARIGRGGPSVLQAPVSAQELWDAHISRRQPAVLDFTLPELDPAQWADAQLTDRAVRLPACLLLCRACCSWRKRSQLLQGTCEVEVETRASSSAAFGRGTKCRMPLSQLLAHLQAGSTDLYLSPQEVCAAAALAAHFTAPACDPGRNSFRL